MGKKIILESREEAGKALKRLAFAFKQSLTAAGFSSLELC